MASSKKNQVSESPQERALAQVAAEKMRDYKERWQPVQMRLAETIKSMGADGSSERLQATGKAASDVEQAFGAAEDQVEKQQMNSGIGAGSSKFRLGLTGMATDKARARGLAVGSAEQAIDNAYIGGLQQIMNLGRGANSTAMQGLSTSARIGAQGAQSDAAIAAQRRAGQMGTAGTLLGVGIGAARGMNFGGNQGFAGGQQYFDAASPG